MKRSSSFTRWGSALSALAVVFVLAGLACDQGNEGDRCNPDLSHDECNSGLSCQQPANCPENYCCPTTGTATNAFCLPGCAGGAQSICAADPDACSIDSGDAPAQSTDDANSSDAGSVDASDAGTD